jgi:hypothetical protein
MWHVTLIIVEVLTGSDEVRDAVEWRSIVLQCQTYLRKSDLRDRNDVGTETACTVVEEQVSFQHDEIALDEAVADGAKP